MSCKIDYVLVNYISPGFEIGAIDVTISENCEFLDGLKLGAVISAGTGFKHGEQILTEKGWNS